MKGLPFYLALILQIAYVYSILDVKVWNLKNGSEITFQAYLIFTFENRIPVKVDRLDFKDIDREKIRDFLKPDRGCEEGITKWFWQNNHF